MNRSAHDGEAPTGPGEPFIGLEDAYAAAWDEWVGSQDALLWDTTSGDGISD